MVFTRKGIYNNFLHNIISLNISALQNISACQKERPIKSMNLKTPSHFLNLLKFQKGQGQKNRL